MKQGLTVVIFFYHNEKKVTYRLHANFLVNLKNQLFVGHQPSIACEVMLGSFDLCRRRTHGGEGQFAQICQNILMQIWMDLS